MTKEQMITAFNEWMRRYTEDPTKFEAEFQTVGAFLTAVNNGDEPDYGQLCAALMEELAAAA
jgi:hypothetical protein